MLARRKFVQSGLLFTATTLLFWEPTKKALAQSLSRDNQVPAEAQRDPVFMFSRETFEPYVGDYFESPGARGKTVALKLIRVDAYTFGEKSRIPAVTTKSFVLLFSAEAPLPTFTSIHPLKHPALGEFNVFLTRRDNKDGDIFYEAVFNHVV